MKKIVLFGVFALLLLRGYAQQLPQFSQFRELPSYHNPAATALFGLHAAVAGRHQWVGLQDSLGNRLGPETYMFFVDMPFNGYRSGIGITALFDQMGWAENMLLRLNLSHHLRIGASHTISMGASADYRNTLLNYGAAWGFSPGNTHLANVPAEEAGIFELGAGLMYSHVSGWYFGVAAHNLQRAAYGFSTFSLRNERHLMAMLGGNLTLREQHMNSLEFLPSLLVTTTPSLMPQYNVQVGLLLNKQWYGGLFYRSQDAVGVQLMFIFEALRMGISYDYSTSRLRGAGSYGSPEVIFSYVQPLSSSARWQGRCYPEKR